MLFIQEIGAHNTNDSDILLNIVYHIYHAFFKHKIPFSINIT